MSMTEFSDHEVARHVYWLQICRMLKDNDIETATVSSLQRSHDHEVNVINSSIGEHIESNNQDAHTQVAINAVIQEVCPSKNLC